MELALISVACENLWLSLDGTLVHCRLLPSSEGWEAKLAEMEKRSHKCRSHKFGNWTEDHVVGKQRSDENLGNVCENSWAASWVVTDVLSNSHKHLPRFSPGYEGTENMFYFLIETRNLILLLLGDRSFTAATPALWNNLLKIVRSATSINSFKKLLKIHLFKIAFDL